MKKSVIILHSPCCYKNSPIRSRIAEVAKSNHVDLDIKELTDMVDMMQYGTSEFPSLVIDGHVVPYRNQSDEALSKALFN